MLLNFAEQTSFNFACKTQKIYKYKLNICFTHKKYIVVICNFVFYLNVKEMFNMHENEHLRITCILLYLFYM